MKVRVISEFYDKFHRGTLYKVGTMLDFEEERAKDVISRKLAIAVTEPKTEAKPKPEPKVETPEVKKAEEKKDVKPEVKAEAKTEKK